MATGSRRQAGIQCAATLYTAIRTTAVQAVELQCKRWPAYDARCI